MKRIVTFLFSMLIALCATAESFHIKSYRWGEPSHSAAGSDITWGHERKGGFDIEMDFEKRILTINQSKPKVYTITGVHPFAYERENIKYTGKCYCIENEFGQKGEAYFRMRDGHLIQIIVFCAGTWCYSLL